MSGDRAIMVLEDMLADLSEIDASELTTFELQLLHRVATTPPQNIHGIDPRLVDDNR